MNKNKKILLDAYRSMKAHAEKELERVSVIVERPDGLNYLRRMECTTWESSIQTWKHAIAFVERLIPDDDMRLRVETLLKSVQHQLENIHTAPLTGMERDRIIGSVVIIEKAINLIKRGEVE